MVTIKIEPPMAAACTRELRSALGARPPKGLLQSTQVFRHKKIAQPWQDANQDAQVFPSGYGATYTEIQATGACLSLDKEGFAAVGF